MECTLCFNDGTPNLHFDDVEKADCNWHGMVKVVHRDGWDAFPKGIVKRVCMEKEDGD